ncbi:hypothetical protein LTR85_010858 [Meristemomyces frigidus]|nr:hypothetical protein LTR85_010858 [Meristemomyces frigidus]
MGGGAFSQASAQGEPTLNTPRMSPDVYFKLKELYSERLRSYFPAKTQVASLKAAPEKADYGDMDFIIAHDDRVDFITIANQIGAAAVICHDAHKSTMAVRRDGSQSSKRAVIYKHVNDTNPRKLKASATVSEEDFAQMDIEIVPTELFGWHSFYASYGDMAGLLGHIVHNLGFTVSDRGFWLRMKELDDSKKPPYKVNVADQDGRILLSHDPADVMQFLGLSVQGYEAGFKTLDELYSWLGECRLLTWDAIKIRRDNAHERNREQKRTVFSRFFNEWLPAHLSNAPTDAETSAGEEANLAIKATSRARLNAKRAELVQEALSFFNKEGEYTAMHAPLVRNIHSTVAAQLLRPILAQHSGKTDKNLNEVARAFRRYVGVGEDGQLSMLETSRTDAESELWRLLEVRSMKGGVDQGVGVEGEGTGTSYGLKHEISVSAWAREHWEEVRALERQRLKAMLMPESNRHSTTRGRLTFELSGRSELSR